MKKVLKIAGIILASLSGIIVIAFLVFSAMKGKAAQERYEQLGDEAPEKCLDMQATLLMHILPLEKIRPTRERILIIT